MSANSKIEWCDHTFNPWIGCTRVSPGCDNCYAAVSTPARAMKVGWGADATRHRTAHTTWAQPKTWNDHADAFQAKHGRRQRVFCASLADVFDNAVDPQWRADLFALIESTPHLDWLLLTKRIGNALPMMYGPLLDRANGWTPPLNLWIGATIVNQEEADRDIPKLLAVPAARRFLSMEPLLGPVDLSTDRGAKALPLYWEGSKTDGPIPIHCALTDRYLGSFERRGWVKTSENMSPWLDWVIVGGESGPGARPMHPDWARSLRDQCAGAGVPFLFKQWGEWLPAMQDGNPERKCWEINASDDPIRVGKKAAGRLLDGITHDGYPS